MDKQKLIQKVLSKEAKTVSPLIGGMMNESFVVEDKGKKIMHNNNHK